VSLELIDLHQRYGDVVALDGLTMTVATGRMHGFVGRNGAGETTAMRVVLTRGRLELRDAYARASE
jgi:ABC-2 type transport system ATP-binding protein